MKQMVFNKAGYDPFIDFLKAYSILIVVFCHGFPYLAKIGYSFWGVQIPLFFLVQVFHCYKREPKPINWDVIWKRIVLPFVAIELIVFGVLYLSGGGKNVIQLLKQGAMSGGYGPGSYYPWVYLQMVIVIPLLRPICEKLGKWKSLLVFILLSVAMEIISSITNLPDFIYRLLCIRYIFLIWIGWIWVKEGIQFKAFNIAASLLSLCSLLYFAYFKNNLEPFFYNSGWTTHRWICYFWVGFAFTWLLYMIYQAINKNESVNKAIKTLATASWEIFLVQMAYYAVVLPKYFEFIGSQIIQFGLWFALAFVVSIPGGIWLHKLETKYILK